MNTDQIAEKAASFFEWPDPQRKDHVTLASCVIFANVIAEMASAKERERCAKVCEGLAVFTHPMARQGNPYTTHNMGANLTESQNSMALACAAAIRGA